MRSLKRLALLGMVLIGSSLSCLASIVVESPDHPKTWVVTAYKVHQFLQWDTKNQCLVADVTYSNILWVNGTHEAAQEDDLELTFPGVHYDEKTHVLSAKGVPIGRRHPLLFGYDIALYPGVEVIIHKHNGFLYGVIVADHAG